MGLPKPHVTYDEYLAMQEASEERLEYLRGEVFAVAGGTPAHAGIATGFILAAPDRPYVEHYRRVDGDLWEMRELGAGQQVVTAAGTLELDAVYEVLRLNEA